MSGIGADLENAQLAFTPFTFGQTTPVTVTLTKNNSAGSASVTVIAENTVGLVATFDPAFVTVFGSGKAAPDTLQAIPGSEYVLSVANGDPGLNTLTVRVNGRPLAFGLRAGETRTINLKTWMTRDSNTIEFSGAGRADSQASLLLKAPASGAGS